MTDKERFRQHCEAHPEIPLFLQYDWMEIVAGPEQWDVAMVLAGNGIQAFMPYFKKRKLRFDTITVPPLTPYMGPWIHYPEGQKESTRLSYEKKLFDGLIAQLPKVDRFIQYFHPKVTNWLPFYWKGYGQSTRYTYILDDISSIDRLHKNLDSNARREINKAKKVLTVVDADEVSTLHTLKMEDYRSKGEKTPYSQAYFQRVFQKLSERNSCKVWIAKDDKGNPVSSLMLVWDESCAYYLAGATDPGNRNIGAMSLLMWTAILFSSSVARSFNFEGSMTESIERFFRSFGAVQTPYFEIRKTDSRLLKLL